MAAANFSSFKAIYAAEMIRREFHSVPRAFALRFWRRLVMICL
jgi:hypothetical protein